MILRVNRLRPKSTRLRFKVDAVAKAGYAHFMLKEIHEQPDVIRQMLRSRIKGNTVNLDGIGLTDKQIKSVKNIVVLACGTAYHAGMVGPLYHRIARVDSGGG